MTSTPGKVADSMASVTQQRRERTLRRLLGHAERFLTRGQQASSRLSWARLGIFVSGAACTILPYRMGWYHAGNGALAVFLLIFLIVARYHNSLETRMHRLRLWRDIKLAHLARLRLDWNGILHHESPLPLDSSTLEEHPYARDLDIIGRYSLFRLLDTTISSHGRMRLGEWLLEQRGQSGAREVWQGRQRLIREISALPVFRDRLLLEAALAGEGALDAVRIQNLLEAPVGFPLLLPVLLIEALLAATTLGLAAVTLLFGMPEYWTLSLTMYVALYLLTIGQTSPVFGRAISLHRELDKLGKILAYLEHRSYQSTPALAGVCGVLIGGADRPSRYVHRLARVTQALSIRAHPLVHLAANAVMPWDLFFTYRLERIRTRTLVRLPQWLETLGHLEAAAALGNFAYLNPEYYWPTLADSSGNGQPAAVVGHQMGHPLLAPGERVTNDLGLRGTGRIIIVTGSNMSGKSTFLRTVGINVCLAQAGAPVCARTFEWSWVRLYCCIRVDDSLEAGLSFFYAEVKRLKRLLDAARDFSPPPVLFLIDEIFKGTNNRERLIGSRAFIRALATSNAFGLITTHDLELTEIEKEIPATSNAHFQETVEANELRFDYRLRPGPCPTTNALRIMALEGLPVPPEGSH
jgi:hypothetical protein